MNSKFVITLLSSSNSKLLKLSYNTIINQLKDEAFTDNIDLNSLIEGFIFKGEWSAQLDPLDLSFFLKDKNTFLMSVERFTWECSEAKDENLLQVLCIIQIHCVDSFIVENILDKKSKGLHSLISIAYDKGILMFTFDQKASIRFI